jgi:hypothetical protein
MTPSQLAGRRYRRRQVFGMLIYVITLGSVIGLLRHVEEPSLLRWVLAVSPALPVLFIIWALGSYLAQETDEVIRAKVVQQLLWGAATALSASTAWGFLEALGGLPHLPAYWVFPVFCLGMMLSLPYIIWKYR